jgi:hypothetical protein
MSSRVSKYAPQLLCGLVVLVVSCLALWGQAQDYGGGVPNVGATWGPPPAAAGGTGAIDLCGKRLELVFKNNSGREAFTNYPATIILDQDNSSIVDTSDFGDNACPDVRFTDSDGTTELDFEIDICDPNGTSIFYVEVPQIDASNTDKIYVYYDDGDGDCSSADGTENKTGTWSGVFEAVWHLSEDPNSETILDSTSNNHDSTEMGGGMTGADSVTTRFGGKGIDFDGTDDYLRVSAAHDGGGGWSIGTSGDCDEGFVIIAWQYDHHGNDDGRLISKADGINEEDHQFMLGGLNWQLIRVRANIGGGNTAVGADSQYTENSWNMAVGGYWDPNDAIYAWSFEDPNDIGSKTSISGSVETNNNEVCIGINPDGSAGSGDCSDGPDSPFDGVIDELWILCKAAKFDGDGVGSYDWLEFTHAHQADPNAEVDDNGTVETCTGGSCE